MPLARPIVNPARQCGALATQGATTSPSGRTIVNPARQLGELGRLRSQLSVRQDDLSLTLHGSAGNLATQGATTSPSGRHYR